MALAHDDVVAAWYIAVDVAATEAEGGRLGSLGRSVAARGGAPAGLVRIATDLAARGTFTDEPGELVLVAGRQPRDIELQLREKLRNADIPLPALATPIDTRTG